MDVRIKYRIAPGAIYGQLTVLGYTKKGKYDCRCDCGTTVSRQGRDLLRGRSVSCGRHAVSKRPEYVAHRKMLERCTNPACNAWPNYGGRGISVHLPWIQGGERDGVQKTGFELFYADVGPRPGPGYSLGRIDNDGPYAPGNVRWETWREQNQNKRDTRLLEHQGRTLCVTEWERTLGFKVGLVTSRLKAGWSVEEALTGTNLRNTNVGKLYREALARIAELEATIARLTAGQ